jgi:molecular chaperone HscC
MATIGIDLGTTNSLVSLYKDGNSIVIPNALGNSLTPSVVSVDEQGMVLVGQAAKERLVTHPQQTAAQFKRLMGTRESVALAGKYYSAEELSSLVLKQLKADAEDYLKEDVDEAIISVPAYFNNHQRTATLNAARLAGLKVERLINEPTAAALAYGIKEENDECNFIIIDLGGGTLDVSILEKFEDILEVHATAGDSFLGGEDFTKAMQAAVCKKLELKEEELSPEEEAHLYRVCDQAKKGLAEKHEVMLNINLQRKTRRIPFNRDDLDQCCKNLLERIREPIERAILDAQLTAADFDQIILVGGATRMPSVRNMIGRMFGRIPATTIDPDQVVAMGAAIQAALKQRNEHLNDTVLTDVCPFSLGIATSKDIGGVRRDGFFSVLIPRNTVVPVSRVERYNTVHDNQRVLEIEVYQGEQRMVKNNVLIGQLDVDVPANSAGAECVDIRFTYDINGVLEVDAQVISTGSHFHLVINNSAEDLSEESLQERSQELAKLKFHPREQSENIALMNEAERMWSEAMGEERNYLEQVIEFFEKAMDTQDPRVCARARVKVQEHLQKLRTARKLW